MSTYIDPDLLGRSTIRWWPEVKAQYGNLSTVSPLYSKFRSMLIQDLRKSERLKTRGLTKVMYSVATYMYKYNYSAPPHRAQVQLENLVESNSLLVMMPVGSKPGTCPHCQQQITGPFWEHVFS